MRPTLLLAGLLAGCGADGLGAPGDGPLDRPVVLASAPLQLTNPQVEPVTWPLWGGAFTTAQDVLLRVDVDATGDAGVVIAGIGFQLHVDAADPPDLASVRANLERFAALGLQIHITELDVSLATEGDLPLQAAVYRDVVETCLAVPGCRDITVFGFTDRHAWDELGDAAPLLFDESYAAKPAFFAVQPALR